MTTRRTCGGCRSVPCGPWETCRYITPDLKRPKTPLSAARRFRVLRTAIAQGPDSIKALHDQLVSDYGEEDGRTIEKLLIGYSAKDAREEATYATLVQQLKAARCRHP